MSPDAISTGCLETKLLHFIFASSSCHSRDGIKSRIYFVLMAIFTNNLELHDYFIENCELHDISLLQWFKWMIIDK